MAAVNLVIRASEALPGLIGLPQLSKYAVAAIVTTVPWQKTPESCFADDTCKPNPAFRAFIIPKLFTIICYQNAAIIPQSLAFKQEMEKLDHE